MKTFEFVEADRKTVLVVDVADDNPIASTLVDLEHLNLTLHAENARLRKVVDAAREVEKIYWNFDRSMRPQIEDLKGALHKLDGENKCDCHNHERQVCDICQGVGGKDK